MGRGFGRAWGSRVRRCCCERAADWGGGEGAGLPECDELFEAGEDAREDGGDQGIQRGRQADAGLLPQGAWGGGDRGAAGLVTGHWDG